MESGVILKSIEIRGLHGMYDYTIQFNKDLTILYGENGSGKTMILHIIANIINADFERFQHLEFESIKLEASSTTIEISSRVERFDKSVFVSVSGATWRIGDGKEDSSLLRQLVWSYFRFPVTYLPAFRTILEAVSRNRSLLDSEVMKVEIDKIRSFEVDRASSQDSGESSQNIEIEGGEFFESSWRNSVKTVLCRSWFG